MIMRNNYVLFGALALCACLSSCKTTYKYVQICTAEPVANATAAQKTDDGLVYENEDCIVSYHFWGEGGDAGFVFYNKTNKVIHIDLSQTFFVKNGVAYDYYVPTTNTKTTSSSSGSTSSATYGGAYYASAGASVGASKTASVGAALGGNGTAVGASKSTSLSAALSASYGAAIYGSQSQSNSVSFGRSESVSTMNQAILSIPPKTKRVVSLYSIRNKLFYDCDLKAYPKQSERLAYSVDNSPLTFANYITYSVGESENTRSIDNQFYISEVANYAEPYIITFVPKEKTCNNVLTPEQQNAQMYAPHLYEAYYNVDGNNTFYIPYSVTSSKKLYIYAYGYRNYIWSPNYNAYTNYYIQGIYETKNNSVAPK